MSEDQVPVGFIGLGQIGGPQIRLHQQHVVQVHGGGVVAALHQVVAHAELAIAATHGDNG